MRRREAGGAVTVRAREMAGVLQEWADSGLSQVAFARRRGIPVGTLAWWRHQLRSQGIPSRRQRGGSFVEVVGPVAPAVTASSFEIVFDGVTVRVPAAFDVATLRAVLGVLGRPC